eukprot:s3531_g7.t1
MVGATKTTKTTRAKTSAGGSGPKFLAPGQSSAKADKKKKGEEGRERRGARLKAPFDQDSGKMMQLMMMSLLMEKSDKKKQKARSFHELRGSSSSESSGSEDEVAGKGMQAVLTLQQLHRQVHRKPLRVCQLFEKEVTEELGIVAGQAWTLKDYIKKQNWGRYKGLQRCAVMDVAAYELIRAGKPDIAAAQLVHNMKAKIQAVLQNGDWQMAWLLTGLPDPLSRKEWAGSKQEMAVVSGYRGLGEAEKACGPDPCSSRGGGRGRAGDRPPQEVIPQQRVHVKGQPCLRHPALFGGNSRFLRYVQWFEGVQGTLLERSGSEIPLFPCALPYPEILDWEILTGEAEAELWWARSFVNTFVAWSNYVVLGCPRLEGGACEPRVGYRSWQDTRLFCDRLLGEVQEFACHDLIVCDFQCDGKRAVVEELLQKVMTSAGACYGAPAQAGTSATTALPVVAARVAVPEEAGNVDPVAWLPEGQAALLANLPALRLPEHQWDEVPVACHQVVPQEEKNVAAKLLETGMAVLVPESELPRRDDGRLLVGGLFGVAKNTSEDRLIFDRRPENSTMPRLDWAALPSGACYTRMLLKPDEFLRGFGDDLRNYYYALELPENWIKYNSVGRRVDKALVSAYGGDPNVPYRLCFRVLGMGDTNGCAIAQATHEAVLKSERVLASEVTLKYGAPVPKTDLWEGVYLDDLLVTLRKKVPGIVPQDGSFIPPLPQEDDPDVKEIRGAEVAYEKAGLKRAIHKSFRMLCQFRAWGAEVDGVTGKVGAPLQVRREVWKLLSLVVRLGWATRNVLEKINGFVCFIFQCRREMFS